jgi:uncharacterized lipoprotein
MNLKMIALSGAVAVSLTLGACSRQSEPAAPLNEGAELNMAEDNVTADVAPPAADAAPQISANQAAAEAPDVPAPGPSEQIRDDADAAGMTARLPDATETAPVDSAAEK